MLLFCRLLYSTLIFSWMLFFSLFFGHLGFFIMKIMFIYSKIYSKILFLRCIYVMALFHCMVRHGTVHFWGVPLSSCHETSRRFLRYGNFFPSTFPEVLLAHASQMTGQLSQSMQIRRARDSINAMLATIISESFTSP